MGFRFRKSIKIMPGVKINISKSGLSTSIGRRGATVNVGKKGVRGTVGLPGTGLSYSEMLTKSKPRSAPPIQPMDAPLRSPSRKLAWIAAGLFLVWLLTILF